jgi:hypothetical protein
MKKTCHGRCVGGPYADKDYVHYEDSFAVRWLEGNPLRVIPFMREGRYEYFPHGESGIWRWCGPTFTKPKETA